jgi:hypothetical protein
MRDETVRKATGRDWAEWFALMDHAGCRELDHRQIAERVRERFAIGPWWAQMVSVEYERARGLRAPNQKCDGDFSVSVSRTIAAPVGELFTAVTDDFVRWAWLPVDDLEPRSAVADRSARFGLADGTRLELRFVPRGERCQVTVDHERLTDGEDVERRRAFWAAHLDALRRLCERTA